MANTGVQGGGWVGGWGGGGPTGSKQFDALIVYYS